MSASSAKPIFDTDFTKFIDTSKLSVPGVNVEAVIEAQRKNAAAFVSAGQTAFESLQGIIRRQSDIVRQNLESMTEIMQSAMSPQTPAEKAASQAESSKVAMSRFVDSVKELTDTVARSQCQVMDAVGNRASEFLDECRDFINKQESK